MNTRHVTTQRSSVDRRPAAGVHILMVGPRPIIREGLGRCLRARGCEVLGEAATPDEGVRQALRLRPHVVVVDATREKAALEFARALTTADRRQRVLLVTGQHDPATQHLQEDLVERAWDHGVHGLVDGATDGDQLAQAVTQVRLGVRHLPPRRQRQDVPANDDPAGRLTRRERQVLTEIACGASTVEAGQRLLLSPATVKHHLSSIHRKLGARSRIEAVMVAMTRGLIDVDPAEVIGRR